MGGRGTAQSGRQGAGGGNGAKPAPVAVAKPTGPVTIKAFESFNARRYGNPWVAKVNPETAKPDFNGDRVGGYTGRYNGGEAGELYVSHPEEGAVYMYGQKDYRGNGTSSGYVKYENGKFTEVDRKNLLAALRPKKK